MILIWEKNAICLIWLEVKYLIDEKGIDWEDS